MVCISFATAWSPCKILLQLVHMIIAWCCSERCFRLLASFLFSVHVFSTLIFFNVRVVSTALT